MRFFMNRNPSKRPGRLQKVLAALLPLAMLLGFTAPASAVPRIVLDDASWGCPEFLAGANHGTGTKVWNFGDVYMNALPTALNGLTVYSNLGTSDPATGLTFPAGVRAYATPSLTWSETDQQPARNALSRGGIYGESNPIAIKLAATAGKTYRVELLAVDMLAVGGRSMSVSVDGQIVSADWYIPVGYPFNKVLAFETLADGNGLDLVIAGGPRNGADHTPAISALAVSEVWTGGQETPLVPAGAKWKYLDDGSDQGTWWRALEFDDRAWASGPAQLGYGDDDEADRKSVV